jgi:hypothetical protein
MPSPGTGRTRLRDRERDAQANRRGYDEAVAREGRALWTLWEVHRLQVSGAFRRRAHRTRREGILAPGLLLAAQMPLSEDLLETMRVTLNGDGRADASVPFPHIQFFAERDASGPADDAVGEALDYLRNLNATVDALVTMPPEEATSPWASASRAEGPTDLSTDPTESGGALENATAPGGAAESEAGVEADAEAEPEAGAGAWPGPDEALLSTWSPADEDLREAVPDRSDLNMTDAAMTFPEPVDGRDWDAMTALASFWDEADPVDEHTEASDLFSDDALARRYDAAADAIENDVGAGYCSNAVSVDPLEDTSTMVSLVCESESATTFDAAIAALPAMRCDLRARYRSIVMLLDQIAAQVAAPHRRPSDPPTAIALSDLERAVDAVWAVPLTSSTRFASTESEGMAAESVTPTSFDTLNRTASPVSDAGLGYDGDVALPRAMPDENTAQEARDVPVCDLVASTLFDDIVRQRTLVDAIRSDLRRGVAFLDDAVADLRSHGWKARPDEFGATWLSSSHFAEAALAAFRQAGMSAAGGETPAQDRQWADHALSLLDDTTPTRHATESDDACPGSSRRSALRSRFAANLLVMRFDMTHALGVADPLFLGQLLRYMVMSTPESAWRESDRLPTVGALLRYGARLTQAYDDAQRDMQSVAFLPMKVFRTECYESALRHTRSKRLWNPMPIGLQLRSAAYRRCFLFTNPTCKERYQAQFTHYREHLASRHARYFAEILLKTGKVHPLDWRRQGGVYQVTYARRAMRITRLLGRYDSVKTLWQARVIWLGSSDALIACQEIDRPDSLAISSLADDDVCQRALNALSWPRRFPLRHQVEMAVRTGRLNLGWMPENDVSGSLYERRLTIETQAAQSDDAVASSSNTTQPELHRPETATSDILHEAQRVAATSLRQYVDAFERDHYTPGSAEWAVKWLPFYGAIEKERGTDTYRINWRRVALDTLEVVAVLTLFGLPIKAMGQAALRAGRRAIRLARSARLAPLSRAYSVLRRVLPHLRGVSRGARSGGRRLRYGFRRGSAEAWRTIRVFYWNRTRAWSLTGRARAVAPPSSLLTHADRSYLAHIEAAFSRHVGMRAMINHPSGMCHDAALVGREILRMVSDRVLYRGVLIWQEGALQPANHIVLLVRRGARTYVLDPTVAQFSRFSEGFERALYLPEGQWKALYRHGFYNEVVKFSDFKTLTQTERLFGVVPRRLGDSLPSSTTLVSPAWYRLGG